MRLKIILFGLICLSISCESEKECQKDFKKKLQFLINYSDDNYQTVSTKKVEEAIDFLENTSSIKNGDQGNILGKFIVTKDDILKWQTWVDKYCSEDHGSVPN